MSKSLQEKIGMRYFVSGRVQGVWYRASTQEQANLLGLTGWAKNLPNGSVEVLAFGEKEHLKKLHAWLQVGPEMAEVTDVTFEEVPYVEHDRFGVK